MKVWNISAADATVSPALGAVTTIEASLNGKAVSGHADGSVLRWDVETGEVSTITKHMGEVTRILILEDGDIASAGKDRTLRVWKLKEKRHIVMREHQRWVVDLKAASADEIISIDETQTSITWNYKTGKLVKVASAKKAVPDSIPLPYALQPISYDNELRLEAIPHGSVTLREGEVIVAQYDFPNRISCMAVDKGKKWIVVGLRNGRTGWLTLEPSTVERPALLSAWKEQVS